MTDIQTQLAPLVIGPLSRCAMGQRWAACNMAGGNVEQAWPTANLAKSYPFWLPESVTFIRAYLDNGATVSGNFDIGVYDEATAVKIASTGATAQSGTNALQTVTVNWTLGPGTFFLALSISNTTARTASNNFALRYTKACGVTEMASAHPLPATFVHATTATTMIPYFGISQRTPV